MPKPNPVPGGSRITVGDREYTFGAIGFDFYYSGELVTAFPFRRQRFVSNHRPLTPEEVARIQDNLSDCYRPEYGHEYRKDSATAPDSIPDPFGIDHEKVVPVEHTAQ